MRFKKQMLAVFSSFVILSSFASSAFADPTSEVNVNDINNGVVSGTILEPSSPQISNFLLAVKASWSYQNLTYGNVINSDNFSITTYSNLTLSVKQYSSTGGGTPTVRYTVRPTETAADTTIYGTYNATSQTITFNNIAPGTYYVQVQNVGGVNVSGSGTIQ